MLIKKDALISNVENSKFDNFNFILQIVKYILRIVISFKEYKREIDQNSSRSIIRVKRIY